MLCKGWKDYQHLPRVKHYFREKVGVKSKWSIRPSSHTCIVQLSMYAYYVNSCEFYVNVCHSILTDGAGPAAGWRWSFVVGTVATTSELPGPDSMPNGLLDTHWASVHVQRDLKGWSPQSSERLPGSFEIAEGQGAGGKYICIHMWVLATRRPFCLFLSQLRIAFQNQHRLRKLRHRRVCI